MQIPSSTYRIQFHHGFTFKHLLSIAAYLEELGITAVYSSPILASVKGSEHGYDGIDPTSINPEIGTIDEFRQVATDLQNRGIGWIQDIVPNHLAFHTDNPWINDILERGISSSYAQYFDIDWGHPFYTHKLMTPFLEKELTECVSEKKIILSFSDSGFSLNYGDYHFPLNITSYKKLLENCVEEKYLKQFSSILKEMEQKMNCPHEEWTGLKNNLLCLLQNQEIQNRISEQIENINADKDRMLSLLNDQHYVLCAFFLSDKQINYRRFFNINSLISLRIENEQVFNHCHKLIYELYQEGLITGLRIDHIDGLKSPAQYINRLRKLFGKDCYIIIEKILDIKEQLPPLDVEGTSGYEFLSYVNQLITDSSGAHKLESLYRQYVPDEKDYYQIVFDNKFNNLKNSLHGDWENLLRQLLTVKSVKAHNVDTEKLKQALGVFMAAYPVYRAYIEVFPLNESDQAMIQQALDTAKKHNPEFITEFNILQNLFFPDRDEEDNKDKLAFLQRLMQFTGPMSAKGVEDTTFYQYNVLISHNEVGDAPCILGIPVQTFHDKMQQRIQQNPLSLNSTSTHDTKRGEDARIRINLLSELTREWSDLIRQCREIAEPLRKPVGGIMAPAINDEYFLYQSVIGSLPEKGYPDETFITRTKDFFIKALRESKLNSNHTYPNTAYEQVCLEFIDKLLDAKGQFFPMLSAFMQQLLPFAKIYSLAQIILKMTAPGIPDIYRGCELWDNSYVDPDNRRPVDYDLRKELLHQVKSIGKSGSINEWTEDQSAKGLPKLFVTYTLLQLRKELPRLFIEGTYIPINTEDKGRNVIAYARNADNEWLLVVLPLGIVHNGKTSIPINLPADAPDSWENVFTKDILKKDKLNTNTIFNAFPVAVLKAFHHQ